MAAAADALSGARLLIAVALPPALVRGVEAPDGSWIPFVLIVVASVTDWFDGALARRAGGPSRHGAALDNAADLALVLGAGAAGAVVGLVPAAVPLAIAASFGSYVLSSVTRSARRRAWQLARSRIGHAAGVLNYGLAILIGAVVAVPGPAWTPALRVGSLVVVALNGAAVLDRVTARARRRAPEPRA